MSRYADRLTRSGRALGLDWTGVREFAESRNGSAVSRMNDEAATLLASLPDNGVVMALDERGPAITSEAFAHLIASKRDEGNPSLIFAIGGPDGHGETIRERAAELIGFGGMTWPHQIVRILLLEQLYRATTILSGHPYHRS